MQTQRFEVLSHAEVERIHAASMEILAEVGIKVSYKTARDVYREAGAIVDDESESVKISETLVQWAINQAPSEFKLYGSDPELPSVKIT
jgi:trimethylamine--corrinoid protein Co-methyltransferase